MVRRSIEELIHLKDTDGDGVIDRDDNFPLDDKESIDTDRDGIGNN